MCVCVCMGTPSHETTAASFDVCIIFDAVLLMVFVQMRYTHEKNEHQEEHTKSKIAYSLNVCESSRRQWHCCRSLYHARCT